MPGYSRACPVSVASSSSETLRAMRGGARKKLVRIRGYTQNTPLMPMLSETSTATMEKMQTSRMPARAVSWVTQAKITEPMVVSTMMVSATATTWLPSMARKTMKGDTPRIPNRPIRLRMAKGGSVRRRRQKR